jgi:rSAM/selenodomain-associated transferase 1
MNRAIIIMTKVPLAGNVKTRLQPFLSANECAALAGAFLRDAARKAAAICENVVIAFHPPSEIEKLRRITPGQFVFQEQNGDDLGTRMYNAFDFAFRRGSDSVVMLGTDSPTFPADFIERAFDLLQTDADAVLGKTTDGGFYLIGLRVWRKAIFENVLWSSPQTFEQTRRNIINLNLCLCETPVWYDIDTPTDFERLRKEFLFDENARLCAPQTFELLQKWEKSWKPND